MGKKEKDELKEFINSNGFFLQLDSVERVERNAVGSLFSGAGVIRTNAKLPEGENIIVFHGRASQQFGVGDASRNGYKIDVAGWDWSNYVKNPQILLQHYEDMPIGRALEIMPNSAGVDILYFVDLKTMGEQDAYKVKGGFFSALSTGHITIEAMFENVDTGERITVEEFYSNSMYKSKDYIRVVTKAEAVEVSVVSLPSNPDALTLPNSLSKFFNSKNPMETKTNEAEVEQTTPATPAAEAPKAEVETPAATEATETKEAAENAGSDTPEAEAPETPAEAPAAATEEVEKPAENAGEAKPEEGTEAKEGEEEAKAEENSAKLMSEAKSALAYLYEENSAQKERISKLEKELNDLRALPMKKGLSILPKDANKQEEEKEAKREATLANATRLVNTLRNVAGY